MAGNADACEAALRPESDESVLWVSYTRPPENCLDRLPSVPDDRKTIVDIGGGARGRGRHHGDADRRRDIGRGAERPDGSRDRHRGTAPRHRGVHVCFDSITAMLQYVETPRAYTFLNSLLGHL